MADRNSKKNSKKQYPWTAKRIAAWIGIVFLGAMYVVTLIFAVFDFPGADKLFRASLGLTIAVPIFLWLFIWVIGYMNHKKTIASFNILSSNPEERKKMEDAVSRDSDGRGSER